MKQLLKTLTIFIFFILLIDNINKNSFNGNKYILALLLTLVIYIINYVFELKLKLKMSVESPSMILNFDNTDCIYSKQKKIPKPYILNKSDEDFANSGFFKNAKAYNYSDFKRDKKFQNLFPVDKIDDIVENQKYSIKYKNPLTKLKNYDQYLDKKLNKRQVSDIIKLKDKLSRFKKLYNQHNHNQWTPHTHIGKFKISDYYPSHFKKNIYN